jgi:hypothetical protein
MADFHPRIFLRIRDQFQGKPMVRVADHDVKAMPTRAGHMGTIFGF